MRIALARDGSRFADQIAELLRSECRELLSLHDARDVLGRLRSSSPDLLVIAEPFFGAELAGFLRRLRQDVALKLLPVLCINGRAGADEGIAALDAGADDFINRPFHAQIFLARVRTLLRRRVWSGSLQEDESTSLRAGGIEVKLLQRQALLDGEPLSLTRLEFDLLTYLVRHADEVLRRDALLAAVWNYPESVETRTLDKHVEALRRKLGRHAGAIETVHAVGYRLNAAPARARGLRS